MRVLNNLKGPGFLVVPYVLVPPLSPSPLPVSKLSLFLSLPVYRRSSLLKKIVRPREILVLCKSSILSGYKKIGYNWPTYRLLQVKKRTF
jgi:hypothetical protein